mgnify:FL=1
MTKDEYINEFKNLMRIKRFQPNTIDTYTSCIKMFLNWCEEADIFPPNLTKSQLVDYLSHTESGSLLRQQIGTIGNFYAWVIGVPYICAGIPYPQKRTKLPDYFTPYELIKIFESVKNKKQRLILKVQYALALRVHEVVKIKWTDFVQSYSHELKTIVYDIRIVGKGGYTDVVPVPVETIQEITEVLGNLFGTNGYLFKGQFKEHYSTRSVQIIINRAMDECRILKYGSTHLLRHSRATHLLQNGSSLRHVQMILRHKKSTTTEIYTQLSKNDLRLSMLNSDNNLMAGMNHQKQLETPLKSA